jgi:hypothetical protein
MALMAFWKSNQSTVYQLSIEQVVTNAGDGALKDDSPCSLELREYLSQVSSRKLSEYVGHCLG